MQRQYGLMAFLFLLLMLCLWAGGLENKPLQKIHRQHTAAKPIRQNIKGAFLQAIFLVRRVKKLRLCALLRTVAIFSRPAPGHQSGIIKLRCIGKSFLIDRPMNITIGH